MKRTIPYKRISAALLLLVYLFIATPVSWWHQHAVATETGSVLTPEQAGDHIEHATHSNDCPVCTHHYSPYTETALQAVSFHSDVAPAMREIFYGEGYNSISLHAPGNRGPPVCC